MTWQTTIITYVRGITNDLGPTAINTDETLEQLIVIAGMMVSEEVDFDTDYLFNVEQVSISPDPSDNTAFINLVALKTACLLARADQKNRARQAFAIKDGPSNIDGRASAEQTTKWADTICKDYADAKLQYSLGSLQPGVAIIGPYKFETGPDVAPRYPTTSEEYFN
jgi:hypothetical protein